MHLSPMNHIILTSIYKIRESNRAAVCSLGFLLYWRQMLTSYIEVGGCHREANIFVDVLICSRNLEFGGLMGLY